MRTLIFTAAMLLGTTVLASNPHRYDAKFKNTDASTLATPSTGAVVKRASHEGECAAPTSARPWGRVG